MFVGVYVCTCMSCCHSLRRPDRPRPTDRPKDRRTKGPTDRACLRLSVSQSVSQGLSQSVSQGLSQSGTQSVSPSGTQPVRQGLSQSVRQGLSLSTRTHTLMQDNAYKVCTACMYIQTYNNTRDWTLSMVHKLSAHSVYACRPCTRRGIHNGTYIQPYMKRLGKIGSIDPAIFD